MEIVQLPAYSPDFMPVEALWQWLRAEVTKNYAVNQKKNLLITSEISNLPSIKILDLSRTDSGARQTPQRLKKNYVFQNRFGLAVVYSAARIAEHNLCSDQ